MPNSALFLVFLLEMGNLEALFVDTDIEPGLGMHPTWNALQQEFRPAAVALGDIRKEPAIVAPSQQAISRVIGSMSNMPEGRQRQKKSADDKLRQPDSAEHASLFFHDSENIADENNAARPACADHLGQHGGGVMSAGEALKDAVREHPIERRRGDG